MKRLKLKDFKLFDEVYGGEGRWNWYTNLTCLPPKPVFFLRCQNVSPTNKKRGISWEIKKPWYFSRREFWNQDLVSTWMSKTGTIGPLPVAMFVSTLACLHRLCPDSKAFLTGLLRLTEAQADPRFHSSLSSNTPAQRGLPEPLPRHCPYLFNLFDFLPRT